VSRGRLPTANRPRKSFAGGPEWSVARTVSPRNPAPDPRLVSRLRSAAMQPPCTRPRRRGRRDRRSVPRTRWKSGRRVAAGEIESARHARWADHCRRDRTRAPLLVGWDLHTMSKAIATRGAIESARARRGHLCISRKHRARSESYFSLSPVRYVRELRLLQPPCVNPLLCVLSQSQFESASYVCFHYR